MTEQDTRAMMTRTTLGPHAVPRTRMRTKTRTAIRRKRRRRKRLCAGNPRPSPSSAITILRPPPPPHSLAPTQTSAPTFLRSALNTLAPWLSPTSPVVSAQGVCSPSYSSSLSLCMCWVVCSTSGMWRMPGDGGSYPTTACGPGSGAFLWYVFLVLLYNADC